MVKGQMQLKARPVEIGELIEAALNSIRPALQAKSIDLHTDIGSAIGTIEADPDRLQQVLWNLLSNAVKFTPKKGGIEIAVTLSDGSIAGRSLN